MAYGEVELKCGNSKCKTVNRIKRETVSHLRSLTADQESAIIKA
jgi:phage FluMu protein Com